MSVFLPNGAGTGIDFGPAADPIFAGFPRSITVAQTWRWRPGISQAGYSRGVQKWGGVAGTFGTGCNDQNIFILTLWYQYGFGALYYGCTTTNNAVAAAIASGNPLHIICRVWDLGGTQGHDIRVNGVLQPVANTWTDTLPSGMSNGSTYTPKTLRIGYDATEGVNANPVEYSECAIWLEKVPDWVCDQYGQGASPMIYPTGVFYVPLVNEQFDNVWGPGAGVKLSGNEVMAEHPVVMDYGLGRHYRSPNMTLNEALKGGMRAGAVLL